ncbi:bestrophin family protein [Robiginitalea sediminis]|uniref:bestrophin family protein n=1 Tax=Robiginitalea sediminis TaxID=1982593 RepID=UPI000B4BDE2D|nr:bestrophin family ion channel [Robiginitalea sediminis]
MYIRKTYGFWMTFNWSKWPFILGTLYGALISGISYLLGTALYIPWGPLGVVGIAVAFYLGFKNNSSYDRTWEARKIWGSIVNNSRSFGAAVMAFVHGNEAGAVRQELLYRHLAWLTALRHQLRTSRPWEHTENRVKGLYAPEICEGGRTDLDSELKALIGPAELAGLQGAANSATQLLRIQSERLQELRNAGYFEDFRHMEFHHLITAFYEDQGKSERIKNFPFPRQYASAGLWITWMFCILVPFGLMDILQGQPLGMWWLCPVLAGIIIWVFFLTEKIGDYSENPFEGTYNDVPITSIARAIEIDLREMLGETEVPPPVVDVNGFLM